MSGTQTGEELPDSGPELRYQLGGSHYRSLDEMADGFEKDLYRQMASQVEREVRTLSCTEHNKFPRITLSGDPTSVSYEVEACCSAFEEEVRDAIMG